MSEVAQLRLSFTPRILCWYSCGVASAVATKKAIEIYGATQEVLPVCCDTRQSEHSDNYRFSRDCEQWFGRPILFIRNAAYDDVDDVFEKDRYMSGINGARCTKMLKKVPRLHFARSNDTHIFGYTSDKKERKRLSRFRVNNPGLKLIDILGDLGVTKQQCYEIVKAAGIALPAMYGLGFDNNNCPGCVKASGPAYWDNVRRHFPEVFKRRAEQSRALGVRLVEIRHHVRIFLDELPPGPFKKSRKKEDLSCGPDCGDRPKRETQTQTATPVDYERTD